MGIAVVKTTHLPLHRLTLKGFTLLEMIVVLAIVAVLMGIALLSIHFDRSAQLLEAETQRFIQLYRATYDAAILTGKPHRLSVRQQNFIIESQSQTVEGNGYQTNSAHLPQQRIDTARIHHHVSPNAPIYFYPSGQTSAFTLWFQSTTDQKQRITLTGDAMGRVTHLSLD